VYLGRRGEHANVIVETSGDTGPAAIAGVTGCANVDIFVLYPHGRITPVQELQMITVDAPNVHVYRTEVRHTLALRPRAHTRARRTRAHRTDRVSCLLHRVLARTP
jgi:threonine synthase